MIKCEKCGKEFSKRGIRLHVLHCMYNKSTSDVQEKINVQNDVQSNVQREETPRNDIVQPKNQSTTEVQHESTFDEDPEYDLVQIERGVWECSNCKTLYDSIEKRCQICGVRFQ